MARVVLTEIAEEARLEIWLRIAEDKISAADRLIRRIDETCKRLARNPYMGEARPDLAPDVRCFHVGNYLILYRPLDDGIQVLLVVHGARDVPAVFRRLVEGPS